MKLSNFTRSLLIAPFFLPVLCVPVPCSPLQADASAQVPVGVTQTPDYVLGPEDQISFHVVDLDDVSDKPVRIDPNGFIDLPLVGRLHVAGLSVQELHLALAQKLAKYIVAPQITISILDYHSQPVSVIGAVANSGIHQLQGQKRLVDMITLAGGVRADAGSSLQITRQIQWGVLPLPGAHTDPSGGYSTAEIPLEELLAGHDPAENIVVKPNDVISVPRTAVVYVVGQVRKAGKIPLNSQDGISLVRALSMAEGLDRDASPKKARIMRAAAGDPTKADQQQLVNVQDILMGKAQDVQLHANDVLFIPNNISGSAAKRAAEAAVQIATGLIIFR